jgi:hypothetical protein
MLGCLVVVSMMLAGGAVCAVLCGEHGGRVFAAGAQAAAVPRLDEPRTVSTRLRHLSVVVLPATEVIVEVVVGDAEYWDVTSAAHMAFIRPLVEGAESNLVILTGAGAVIPLKVIERGDESPVDAVVHLSGDEVSESPGGPVLAPVAAVAAAERRAAAAWESVAEAEANAEGMLVAARNAAEAELDAERESYPRQLRFDYRWEQEPGEGPWLVEGMWHDGERTFLRSRATNPAIFERVGDELRLVAVERVGEVVHVAPRVLGAGVLEVDGKQLSWRVAARKVGP